MAIRADASRSEESRVPRLVSTVSGQGEAVATYLEEGEIVDRFRIGRVLGVGGHGVVYEAEHVELGYPVAVKVMERCAGLDPRRRARFRREAIVGASLRHRNVVGILEAGELRDGSPYLVMEHVDGIELASILSTAPLSPAAVIDLGVQLCAAITALSAHGIVHRDIKPQNVMLHRAVDDAIEVKLLDFGICKALRERLAPQLTQDGFVLGTPHYMSPEQIRGEPLDARSDLFAVGTVLYEAIAGAPTVDGTSSEGVLTQVLVDPPMPIEKRRPDFPSQIAGVVERALVKDREKRWQSPSAMAEALLHCAADLGFPRGGEAWTHAEGLSGRREPQKRSREAPASVRIPLRLVSSLGSPQVAARFLPTPPECPSARRMARGRARPKYMPPWWPAAAALLALAILSGLAWSNVSMGANATDHGKAIYVVR